ncbi:hypothetical protein Dsin_018297 [Dipteronia sinensis]|uniref:Peptidase A2 domain-containing protein n=1 Tax=Dipteronia sinensis TaxID=43782 RepID=A0AAE0E1X2_9ROSI|nr:hypothetical protein Dsin_018297 [Dipteronia sinensis]
MVNSKDGSQSPPETNTPRGVDDAGLTNTSAARGDLHSRTPTSIRQNVITSTEAIPSISPDVFSRIQESLWRVIEDVTRQGINITVYTNLTSPYQLSTLMVAQDPRFDERVEPEGERKVLLRKIEDLERRQGRGNLLIGNFGSPLATSIKQACFLEKFNMPHVEQFKANIDPQEQVRRYQNAMAQYDYDDALLCRMFPQTLRDHGLDGPDQKKLKQGWDPIVFSEADAHRLKVRLNDAIVVSVHVGHGEVTSVLIDKGISTDILSVGVFDQLGLQRKDLQPLMISLRGFGGAKKTVLLDFVVVDTENWPYNDLLERPILNKTKAVMATYALTVKFQTETGVGVMKGSHEWIDFPDQENCLKEDEEEEKAETLTRFDMDPNETSLEDGKDHENEQTNKVIIDDKNPEQTVKLGAQLTEQVQSKLVNLLKEHKDVFAWKHEDM